MATRKTPGVQHAGEPQRQPDTAREEGPVLFGPDGDIPFGGTDESLKAILHTRFIQRTARWLMPEHSSLLPFHGGSNWETALAIEFLKATCSDLPREHPLVRDFNAVVPIATNWFLNQKSVEGGLVNWDGVTWDTSVVLRALIASLDIPHVKVGEQARAEAFDAVTRGFAWCLERFYLWEREVKYPVGESDVAQILILGLQLRRDYPGIYRAALALAHGRSPPAGPDDPLRSIVEFLISRKEGSEADAFVWGDFLNTSDVVEALALYEVSLLQSKKRTESEDHLLKDLHDVNRRALHAIERGQVAGMWGTMSISCRTLDAYLRACAALGQVPQDQIVFKCLRWMCDPKQTYEDGSFQHSVTMTVYYAQALIQVERTWELARKPILEVYDDVVWLMSSVASVDRGRALSLEVQLRSARLDLDRARARIIYEKRRYYTALTSLMMAPAVAIAAFVGRGNDAANSIVLTTLGALYVGFLTLVWTYSSFAEN